MNQKLEKELKNLNRGISPDKEWVNSEVHKFVTVMENSRTTNIESPKRAKKSLLNFFNIKLMENRLIYGLIAVLALVAVTTGIVIASDDSVPGDLLYSVDRASEKAGLTLTGALGGDYAKSAKYLSMAEERLEELRVVTDTIMTTHRLVNPAYASSDEADIAEVDQEVVDQLLEDYESHLDKAKELADKVEDDEGRADVYEQISEATIKHQKTLADVYDKVPEEAYDGITRAMEASQKGRDTSLEKVGEKRQQRFMEQHGEEIEEIQNRVKERMEEMEMNQEAEKNMGEEAQNKAKEINKEANGEENSDSRKGENGPVDKPGPRM